MVTLFETKKVVNVPLHQICLGHAIFENPIKIFWYVQSWSITFCLKYPANEAVAFILTSDSESNDSFGDESSLEPSDIYDSE